ncbi:type II secretion system protein [Gilvimarinus japonicus]|uniref:Type II secretion system protein n=2 Tax=Gilvimarinus japonicus TaxID=1796469 RepID=A0ABV7HVL7_9GAMM
MRNSCYKARYGGFSLLEMMVAVAIMGISLGMLYKAAGGSVRSVSTSEDYVYAISMAESLLAMHSLVPLESFSVTGVTGDGYSWEVISTSDGLPDEAIPYLRSIVVTVSWGGAPQREFSLHSVVPIQTRVSNESP